MSDKGKEDIAGVSYRALLVGVLMAAFWGFAAPDENRVIYSGQ